MSSNYIQVDNYFIYKNKIIGSGGFATVYLGYYAKNRAVIGSSENKLFAIKEISINSGFEVTSSLIREINVLRHLKNNHIITFIDAKKTENHFYLIMEYCSEGTLEDLISSKQLTENQIHSYFFQIVHALEYLHSKKIFHRDIKPKNILLHNGEIKLVDFGLSKIIADQNVNITLNFNTCVGTPSYMAPEMLKGLGWEEKSDIWSLGVTLYFMVFKELPWSPTAINDNIMILEEMDTRFNRHSKSTANNTTNTTTTITGTTTSTMIASPADDQEKEIQIQSQGIEELHYLIPKGKSLNDYPTISLQTLQLIDAMLQVNLKKRINWAQLFSFPPFLTYLKQSQIKLSGSARAAQNQESLNAVEEITPESILVTTEGPSGENQEERQRYGELLNDHIESIMKKQQLEKSAKTCIEYEQQKAQFLHKVATLLKAQHSSDPNFIPNDLYLKCQLLLYKRANIILLDLSKMMAFRLNTHGCVFIEENIWKAFVNNWDQSICENIIKETAFYEKKFSQYQMEYHQAFKKMEKFDLIHRGDAYSQSLDENQYLVQAYNDNFLKLFQILAEKAFILRKEDKLIGKRIQQIFEESKIDIVFIYYLMAVISFRNCFVNPEQRFSQFYQQCEAVGPIELLNRIQIAYNQWQPMNYN